MKAINPASGLLIQDYPELSDANLERKLANAAAQFTIHRNRSFEDRKALMRNVAEVLRERKTVYSELMTEEMGKRIEESEAEIEKCAWVCQYFAEHTELMLEPESVETDASSSHITFQPIGPVLAIMPWNFPFWQVFRFAAPALMAGNVGLLKHASNVPGCALAIEEIFRDAGYPDGCMDTLLIGVDRVEKVIADERVAAVTLTGSEAAGRAVAATAGKHLKKAVLELGGSDPFVIMPSADIDAAISAAVQARMLNNGQSCIAAKRYIVHESLVSDVQKRLEHRFNDLALGDPMDRSVTVGPMAREEFVDQLVEQVRKSVDAGAELLTGGERADHPGFFMQPTLLTNVRPGMPVFDSETFGPVAPIIPVASLDEAIATANATRYGLGASVWTSNSQEADAFVKGIESGSVFVNGIVKSDPRLPFGGVKSSGFGRELSRYGLLEFCNVKTVWRA
jgi:succinate-semialdehyde dehydrogenase/glutarate-semialdehyde dehydrogenase